MNRTILAISASVVFLSVSFFNNGVCAAKSGESGSGISEAIASDTVRIPNSSRSKESIYLGENPVTVPSHPTGRVAHKGKVITGAALFGATYALSLVVAFTVGTSGFATTKDNQLAASLCVPGLGPMIGYYVDPPNPSVSESMGILCAAWSAAECIGLTLLITGLVGTPAKQDLSALPVSIEPIVMKNGGGFITRMRF